MSVPLAISGFNGECANRDSLAKFAGRMLAYRPSALRSLRRPCSGRTGPTPHFGPPTAPASERAEGTRISSRVYCRAAERRTEQDGISTLTSGQRRFGQGFPVVIDPCSTEMVGLDVECKVGLVRDELKDADGFSCYFGTCDEG